MAHRHIIKSIEPGSIAEELGIEKGDILLSINDQEVEDVFDYHFYVNDEQLVLTIEKPDGEEWELEIEKDYEEDLGIEFEQGLMDEYRSCRNKCIFCFIDQMPKGMRDTLYFKDDDSRLSFLQGNYVTLTNMSDHDIDRIIRYHLEPINISFHTTNPELRCQMLHNRFAGEALRKVDRLYEAGIEMNGQIVLCRGINDGEELERSIRDLAGYLPYLQSVSVVPVGLTRYRDGLYPLEPFTPEDARKVLEVVRRWQDELYEKWGTHFIHAGDEWYLLAGEDMPPQERYDGYLQLENGVGMMRLLEDEFREAFEKLPGDEMPREVSVATGKLAYPLICGMAEKLKSNPGKPVSSLVDPQPVAFLYTALTMDKTFKSYATGLEENPAQLDDMRRGLTGGSFQRRLHLDVDMQKVRAKFGVEPAKDAKQVRRAQELEQAAAAHPPKLSGPGRR